MNQELNQQIINLLHQGNKIEAVKLAKESLNLGLKEAKDLVDAIESGQYKSELTASAETTSPSGLYSEKFVQQILDLLFKNQKIMAVKLVVETQGLGLREAKDYVDKIEKMI
ncbi:MAG: ribosomal protein L7/L12 [Microscillaceae bacterium]|jgi:ribosomal protein L7/L12|nr:ribosomal protein L7/L12 [Microscillaceae bacterium]